MCAPLHLSQVSTLAHQGRLQAADAVRVLHAAALMQVQPPAHAAQACVALCCEQCNTLGVQEITQLLWAVSRWALWPFTKGTWFHAQHLRVRE